MWIQQDRRTEGEGGRLISGPIALASLPPGLLPPPRSGGPERASRWLLATFPRKAQLSRCRVLTVHRCGCPRDGQGQEEDKEGQTPGQTRSRHHIHAWELGKGALEGGRREGTSEHPPLRAAGWTLPSQHCPASGPLHLLVPRPRPHTPFLPGFRAPHVVRAERAL